MPKKKKRVAAKDTNALEQTRQFQLLKGVLKLLLHTGPTKKELQALVAKALDTLEEKNTTHAPWLGDKEDLSLAIGRVFQAWHRQRDLLDDKARPIPLRLMGETKSIQALIKQNCPDLDATSIAKEILNAGLIKATAKGTYVPRKLHLYYYGAHPVLLMNSCRNAIRFMDTLNHNITSKKKDSLYIERVAHVTNLPKDKLRAFFDLASQQSNVLLNTTNDWLESNNESCIDPKKTRAKTLEAGLHLFAFASANK